jgi:hypothetical protein
MLYNKALVPTMQQRMLFAQRAQALLERACLLAYARPVPPAGNTAGQEQ